MSKDFYLNFKLVKLIVEIITLTHKHTSLVFLFKFDFKFKLQVSFFSVLF